jgi:hypothetical protein
MVEICAAVARECCWLGGSLRARKHSRFNFSAKGFALLSTEVPVQRLLRIFAQRSGAATRWLSCNSRDASPARCLIAGGAGNAGFAWKNRAIIHPRG